VVEEFEQPEGAALGTPAPFTQEQVDSLVRGKADGEQIAHVLQAHERPELEASPVSVRNRAPVRLSRKALEEVVSKGRTPRELAKRLATAGRSDKNTQAEIDDRSERPREKPPRHLRG